MKALLVLQEGPGAGKVIPLDPDRKAALSIGRSSECDIVLPDGLASRHHADIRWNGHQWTVVDQGSRNGTYVNGMQVHGPYDLRSGDRVSIGETTLVLREAAGRPAGLVAASPQARPLSPQKPVRGPDRTGEAPHLRAPGPAAAAPRRAAAAVAPRSVARAEVGLSYWLIQGLILVALVCLALGAFLPWIRVRASLSLDIASFTEEAKTRLQERVDSAATQADQLLPGLGDLLRGAASYLSPAVDSAGQKVQQAVPGSGQPLVHEVETQVGGLQYGYVALGLAVLCLIVLLLDIFLFRHSTLPGLAHVLLGVIALAIVAFDVTRLYHVYQSAESLLGQVQGQLAGILQPLGIQLGDLRQWLDKITDIRITPQAGLILVAVGMALVLAGGVARLAVALSRRPR